MVSNMVLARVASRRPPLLLDVLFRCRRVKKEDMRRIAKATGASIVTTLADMEGNETFDVGVLGEAEEVSMAAHVIVAGGQQQQR